MVGLKDVARQTGFAVSVVSRALSPKPDPNARVSAATRRLIREAARRLGYRRNRAAEFMKRGGSPTVGVFVPAAPNRLLADLLLGLADVLTPQGFPMQVDASATAAGFRRFFRRNLDAAHSGVIGYPYLVSDPQVSRAVATYRTRGGHVVLLNTTARPEGVPVVAMDERAGGALAAARLLARGCRRFAVLGDYQGRADGFREALAAQGATAVAFESGPNGLEKAAAFCRRGPGPAGVFAVADALALRLIRLLQNRALRVGREVLVVGYDDLELAVEVSPALTTVHQPFRDLGRLAARKLIGLIYGKEESSVWLPPRLVVRETA